GRSGPGPRPGAGAAPVPPPGRPRRAPAWSSSGGPAASGSLRSCGPACCPTSKTSASATAGCATATPPRATRPARSGPCSSSAPPTTCSASWPAGCAPSAPPRTTSARPTAATSRSPRPRSWPGWAAGARPPPAGVRAALQADPSLPGRLLAELGTHLPYGLLVVVDQCEEVFPLARTDEDRANRRTALEILRQAVLTPGDFKLVLTV